MPLLTFDPEKAPAKPTWSPTPKQLEAKKHDEQDIQLMVDYQSKYTSQWEKAARAWNLLAEPIDDNTVSNILFPFARIICTSVLTAISKGRPGFGMRPGGPSDYAKVELLWKPAINNVLDESLFDTQQEFFLNDWEVFGTGVYEVFSQTPMRTVRDPLDDAGTDYREILKPDYTRPKLGVRYRTPYECGISPYARTPEEAPSCYFQEAMSWEQFVENYARCTLPDGRNKYMNTEHVFPGKICNVGTDGTLQFRESEHKGVICVTYQSKIRDVCRIWANGVLIYDRPLRKVRGSKVGGSNALGVTSLCWGVNWHQRDPNLRTHALYGMGDPHLVRGLDIIYQAFSNMTVDNWVRANTNLISFKSIDIGTGSGAEEELTLKKLYSGYVLKNRGEVISTPLGQVNLAHYGWFREFLEESSMWLSRTNYKRLVGETSTTAYELFQKIESQNEGYEFRLKKLERCYAKMGRLLLGGVMSDLTVEDYEELTERELEDVLQGIKEGRLSPDDFDRLASLDPARRPRRRKRYMIRIPGRVFTERPGENGKYGPESLQEVERYAGKQDGYIPARQEYLWSQEYIERGAVPDVFVTGKQMLGDSQNVRLAKVRLLAEYARVRIAEGMQVPELKPDFDMKKIDRQMVQAVDVPEDDVMKKGDAVVERIEQVDSILDVLSESLRNLHLPPLPDAQGAPLANPQAAGAQPPTPFVPAPTPDFERFTPFGGQAGGPAPALKAAALGAA